MHRTLLPLTAFFAVALSIPSSAREDLSAELKERLAKREGVPGVVAIRIADGKIEAAGAAGIRKAGDDTPVELQDKFHLGSCTKAMTATLAAILVERGKITWNTTIGDVIKGDWVEPGYRDVTLAQLLSHTGGCPGDPPKALWLELFTSTAKPRVQREKLARGILSQTPSYPPGEGFEYSNSGYAVAGVMIERITGTAWEELMQDELFEPLEMTSAGFRAPAGGRRRIDQPWGHRDNKPVPPKPFGDNPDAIGPAGTVHCSVEDWAKFALLHLEAKPGTILKKQETFAMLRSPQGKDSRYSLGWLVDGKILAHDGSNTMWYASIKLNREDHRGVLVCANSGSKAARDLCHEVVQWLSEEG